MGRLDYAPKPAQEESGHSPHHEECSGYTTMARSRGCTLSLLIPAWVKEDQRPYGGPVVSKLGHARGEGGSELATQQTQRFSVTESFSNQERQRQNLTSVCRKPRLSV
ncbi:unnamed protein product [Sphagnum troendelagicum]